MSEIKQGRKEFFFTVHVRRIQPYHGIVRQKSGEGSAVIIFGNKLRTNVHTVHLTLRQLGVAVEYADAFDFVSEERYPERIVERVRKYVHQPAPHGILARLGNEIRLYEPLGSQPRAQSVEIFLPAFYKRYYGRTHLVTGRDLFFQSFRISDQYRQLSVRSIHDPAQRSCPLHLKRGFIVAPLYLASGIGQKKHSVPVYHVIQVGSAILGRFLVRKHYEMDSGLYCR